MNTKDAKNLPGSGGTAAHAERKMHEAGFEGSNPASDEGILLTMTGDGSSFNPAENAGAGTIKSARATPEMQH